ncbi:MAG: branched-chain amino acid ABC transporter substrate-binding protein [Mycobacteriales bacterium]
MRHKVVRAFGVLPVAVALVALPACSKSNSSSGGSCGGVELGYFGVLSGQNSPELGVNIYNGAKLAVDQHNAKHKNCKVNLKKFDSQGDPGQASTLAPTVIQDRKLVGVVGPAFSGESEAVLPAFNSAGLPVITASATRTSLGQKGWKVFHRGLGNDAQQGTAAAKYIKDDLKAQKVYVIDDQSAYGAGLADVVKQGLGSLVIGTDHVKQKDTDFSAAVGKVKSSGATVLFYGGYYAEAGPMLSQLKAAGVTATFISGDGSRDEGLIKAGGASATEGALTTCPCAVKTGDKFATDYKAKWGKDPGIYSAEAFDAANIFLKGIDAGKTTRPKMLTYVNGYQGQGETKHFKFDSHGELDKSSVVVWLYKVQNGAIVLDKQLKL